MNLKLTNYATLRLIVLFYIQEELTPPQEASVDICNASQKACTNALQHKEYQILAYLWKNCMNFYLTEKITGPSQHLEVTQWMASIDGKEKHDAFSSIMEEKNPTPPKQVPKTVPVAIRSNSNMKKQPQAQNKGKGKAPATKPYFQGYRIPKIQQDAM
ncbi:hypothetical protein O181_054550 [Austropuccinia psidii MF-1]|uniref:Uncharacterized protein n=1 Tax=Austropuccinia psidii MF-1 TaxID=1389203 RepID=A0A9Q3E918_9BASI|nr:hypothetical protein [Austropuccinia psidii MF-1]